KFDPDLDFFENLLPGIILCELMETLFPDAIESSEIHRDNNEMFHAANNITVFNESCAKLDIQRQNFIVFSDLRQKKNIESLLVL
ncbi:calponin homology domain-containing protein, partial [Lactiplantibacillus plantarum]|uniref:calponin homology domain-containing protein n=1 Tax=Lactiplantibacillus plantarum TaxID=1590 RepID=UPI0038525A0C